MGLKQTALKPAFMSHVRIPCLSDEELLTFSEDYTVLIDWFCSTVAAIGSDFRQETKRWGEKHHLNG